jgi:hypothetical protein
MVLGVLWEREKTQSIAFGSSVVAPKRCTGHHLELLAISPMWMFVLVRLCSTHFTRDCFERDPLRMMELGVDGTFKRRLKPDATP